MKAKRITALLLTAVMSIGVLGGCGANVRQYKAIGNAVPPVMMWHIANSLQRSFEITDGDYDKAAPQVTPQYAFHNNSLQGYLFEQGPSYGTNQKQINK